MAIDDLEHENATATTENASHASSNDEFEEGSSSQNILPMDLPVNSPVTEGPSPAMGGAELVETDEAPSVDEIRSAVAAPALEGGQTMGVAPAGLGHDDTAASVTQLVAPVAKMGGSSSAAANVSELRTPLVATAGGSTSLVAEGGTDAVEDEYESKSDLDPEDVRMFREGFTNPVGRAEGRSRFIELTVTNNYSLWYRSMRIALIGRNKLGIVDGKWTKEQFREKYWYQWERCNAIVLSWMMNSVAPTLISGIAYATSVIYKRGLTKLKDLWDESESVIPTDGCDCVKTKEFIIHLQKQKVYQFLMGLNDSYSQARSQILMMKPLPSGNQPYAMLMSDESQRVVAASAGILGSQFFNSNSAKPSFNPKFRKNYNIQCGFCKMKGHSREKYFKIIGYPSDYKFKKKRGAGPYNARVEPGYTMHMYSNHVSNHVPQSTPMPHLRAYQNPQQNMNQGFVYSQATNQAQGHSGPQAQAGSSSIQAQDLPQVSLHGLKEVLFLSLKNNANMLTKTSVVAPSKPRRVLLPNGDVTQVTHTGDSNISDISTLKEVFYDLFCGRVREIGRERDGLYFLQRYGGKKLTTVSLAAAGIKLRQGNTIVDVALWHKRLGHVSSSVHRKLFAAKLTSINDTINNCSVRLCARQTRLSFPSSCIKTIAAFDLIHLDVWGLYNYETFDGNKYFLTFNKIVKAIRSDNGSEFVNSNYTTLFQKYGIIHQSTYPCTLQQNGVAERKHRHILEVTRALRFQANIPIKYSVLAAVYIINKMTSSVLHGLSPFELMYGKAKPVVLMGFSDTQKAYIRLDLSSYCFFIKRDVSFKEDIFPFKDITATSPHIFLPPGLSNSSEEQPSLPSVPARHVSTDSSHLHQ
ncbi:PREDICTED: uncharacterized protein LOC109218768 [Nicotiana attenuata]|uniref:uncharacterized protein LOC109218768 n=1 Tax=Nicotiana attenuata TaxID=49451 RepID=UPI000905ABBD|nr:PREDICTED: uncharacterized protein LOC109218768 [Nicotiana attenuata]